MKKNTCFFYCIVFAVAICRFVCLSYGGELERIFDSPPGTAKPGVYWYFMDGNMSPGGMTKDLESMKESGIDNVLFLEVNIGIPRGDVNLMSDRWLELFKHAVDETKRLGISMTLGIGPGWTGSGGPWVAPDRSMQHLVAASTIVEGTGPKTISLPVPPPRKPFFGEAGFPPEMKKQWNDFFEDVAVLAFPTPENDSTISDIDEKALYYRAPYTSQKGVKPFLPMSASYEGPKGAAISPETIVDLSDRLRDDGTLQWDVPEGRWTVLRFGQRNNGAVTRPAPLPGVGMECDKFDADALRAHLENFTEKIFKVVGEPDPRSHGGLTMLHLDSWEMGAQNWTKKFHEEFLKRRGYDPKPFYPTWLGLTVDSLEKSERFLWDLRMTAQELVLENHVLAVKEYARKRGLGLSIEPYDMNPNSDLDLGALADVPMCEFWSAGYGFDSAFSCIEATSIAHVEGRPVVAAEAFTSTADSWRQYPGSMKNQGDWAFCMGINRFVFHTFQHQSLDEHLKPGVTMGVHGVHWNRHQTWWPMAGAYHAYLSRCQALLQQGRTVADILYLAPEGAPVVFVPPKSALATPYPIPDKKGYSFDACSPLQLMKAEVREHRITFPGGASYAMLVLPAAETMTPELLEKLKALLEAGAMIVGTPPKKSPSLVGYPACDQRVRQLTEEIWGGETLPESPVSRSVGKGKIVFCMEFVTDQDNLYPRYEKTAALLTERGAPEDFTTTLPVRFIHKTTPEADIYFIANRSDQTVSGDCAFRVIDRKPLLWDPVTTEKRPLPQYSCTDTKTTIPISFEPFQSFFVLFPKNSTEKPASKIADINFPALKTFCSPENPWTVSFDPTWGGPEKIVFEKLIDWTKHSDDGIKYYSGTAVYEQEFDLPPLDKEKRYYLDLGKVCNLARITLNGKDLGVLWTAPWRIEATGVLREKGNNLRVEVVNLWPNRIIGDEQLPVEPEQKQSWPPKWTHKPGGRFTFTTWHQYKKETPLLESGLIGPVTIKHE